MITKIKNSDDLYPEYNEFSWDIVLARYKEWQNELEPLYPLMKGHRFFVIFEPAHVLLHNNVCVDEKPFAWAILPDTDDTLAERILKDFCTKQGQYIARRFPGVGHGSFKDTPYENTKILELTPELFLVNFFSRCILGYFGRLPLNMAFDITIKGMPGKEYCGITGEVEYDPETGNFKDTPKPYKEIFNDQYNRCEKIYDPLRYASYEKTSRHKKEITLLADELGFKKGTRVTHPKRGAGTILNLTKDKGGIRVQFDNFKAPAYIYGDKLRELTSLIKSENTEQ